MTALLDVMAVRATGDPGAAVVQCAEPGARVEDVACDVLVVGGGTGGAAAAGSPVARTAITSRSAVI